MIVCDSVFDPSSLLSKKIVDLSLPISAHTVTYPRDPSARIEVLSAVDEGGSNTTCIVLSAHSGTHVDVPYHLFKGGKSVDELPLETFCGSALMYDITHKAVGSRIYPEDFGSERERANWRIALFYTRFERSEAEWVGN